MNTLYIIFTGHLSALSKQLPFTVQKKCTHNKVLWKAFIDAMLVSFGQNCLHPIFWPYLSSETYPYKYEKLPNVFIHTCTCKTITDKLNLLKMCGLQFRLCLFTFWPIALKQLNSLTTINTFSLLVRLEVTHPTGVLGSIPGSGKEFMFCFVVVVLLLFFGQKYIICHESLQLLLQW